MPELAVILVAALAIFQIGRLPIRSGLQGGAKAAYEARDRYVIEG